MLERIGGIGDHITGTIAVFFPGIELPVGFMPHMSMEIHNLRWKVWFDIVSVEGKIYGMILFLFIHNRGI
jgi:hypothetical protein